MGSVWNVPLSEPGDSFEPSADQSMKFPPFSHRDSEPRGAVSPAQRQAVTLLVLPSPTGAGRCGARRGRKFPRSEWLAES